MKRMSQSKLYVEPSLPFAIPWISVAATKPLKSPIVFSSPPFNGWRTCAAALAATGLKLALKPPAIGFGPATAGVASARPACVICSAASAPSAKPPRRRKSARETSGLS